MRCHRGSDWLSVANQNCSIPASGVSRSACAQATHKHGRRVRQLGGQFNPTQSAAQPRISLFAAHPPLNTHTCVHIPRHAFHYQYLKTGNICCVPRLCLLCTHIAHARDCLHKPGFMAGPCNVLQPQFLPTCMCAVH